MKGVRGGHSRPRKHCRVINIPKHNAAALTAARRRYFRSHVSALGDDMLGREFGARIGSCFGQKAPRRKNEEVAQVRAAKGARRQLECARCVRAVCARVHTHTHTRNTHTRGSLPQMIACTFLRGVRNKLGLFFSGVCFLSFVGLQAA